jgi:hypothetical protein
MSGIVKNLVSSGKAGFIHGENGSEYYFRVQWYRGSRHRIQPRLRALFHAEKNVEPSKKDNAVYVEATE